MMSGTGFVTPPRNTLPGRAGGALQMLHPPVHSRESAWALCYGRAHPPAVILEKAGTHLTASTS